MTSTLSAIAFSTSLSVNFKSHRFTATSHHQKQPTLFIPRHPLTFQSTHLNTSLSEKKKTKCCDTGSDQHNPEHKNVNKPAVDKKEQEEQPTSTSTSTSAAKSKEYQIRILKSIDEISCDTWDSFAKAGCNSPFLHYAWLSTLEKSGSATSQTGWAPSHLVIEPTDVENQKDDVRPIAIIPAYLKSHSMGEFVFDHEWADAAYGVGISYYPKLLIGVPFTPATGRRILTHVSSGSMEGRQEILNMCSKLLIQVCHHLNISSVHVNFCKQDEVNSLKSVGFLHRKGIQYHFTNYRKGQNKINELEEKIKNNEDILQFINDDNSSGKKEDNKKQAQELEKYADFNDYLSEFKSKKRIKMKRERSIVRNESGLKIDVLRGDEISDDILRQMYFIYKSTIDKLLYGRQYLTQQFFELLNTNIEFKNNHICLIIVRKEDGEIIAGTFNIVGGNEEELTFYGRYWGSIEEHRFLHFETCYYAAIEWSIDHGLIKMEPGAGGGDFKYIRGFEPCVTNSMHYLKDARLANAVDSYLTVESLHVEGAVSSMKQQSAIRSKSATE